MATTDYNPKNPTNVVPFIYQHTVTIDTGATGLSSAIDLSFLTPVAIQGSTDWDTADLTFQCSYDNVTFCNMYDDSGNEYTVSVPTTDGGDWLSLDPADFVGINYIKLRSGTSGTPVQQTNASTLFVYTRRVG